MCVFIHADVGIFSFTPYSANFFKALEVLESQKKKSLAVDQFGYSYCNLFIV